MTSHDTPHAVDPPPKTVSWRLSCGTCGAQYTDLPDEDRWCLECNDWLQRFHAKAP